MRDGFGREIDYLRISVTDKCNLRCRYCMPVDIEAVPMSEILTFEEVTKIVDAASCLGIRKIRVTGGEPLVRRDICTLIRMLKSVGGIEEVTITTNGILLSEHIEELKSSGIDGINISLDTLDRDRYKKLTGYDELDRVLDGISAVTENKIPVKINTVSVDWKEITGVISDPVEDVVPLVELARDKDVDVRFIELMPIGFGKGFPGISHDLLITAFIKRFGGMDIDIKKQGNGPAVYYRIPGFTGDIGFISALHGPFCEKCNRIRLTTKGFLKTCLCYDEGEDLKRILKSYIPEEEKREKLISGISDAILCKPKSHCFVSGENISEKNPMSRIGG